MNDVKTYKDYFDFELSSQQTKVFDALCAFEQDSKAKIFVLKGYAGTGKTSLIGGFIKKLNADWKKSQENSDTKDNNSQVYGNEEKEPPFVVLASTGRVAKILSDKTIVNVKTIHSLVYRFVGLSQDVDKSIKQSNTQIDAFGQMYLDFDAVQIDNTQVVTYIVDEASMVSDKKTPQTSTANIGDGNVLDALMNYDKKGKFIFVGDPCQLPPINQKESPALDAEYLRKKYNVSVTEYTLTEIFRQQENNDILKAASVIRNLWQDSNNDSIPKKYVDSGYFGKQIAFDPLPLRGYNRINVFQSEIELYTKYIQAIKENGYEYATLICNSNAECSKMSNLVRESFHGKREPLIVGDLLLVTQNNYVVDLVNGDLVEVEEVGETKIRAGLHFTNVRVKELASKQSYNTLLLFDLLRDNLPNINGVQHWMLMMDFIERMVARGIKFKPDVYDAFTKNKLPKITKESFKDNLHFEAFRKNMLSDPFLNALRTAYGYALTCHKSQGGEWNQIFLYMGTSIFRRRSSELYQWAYTAITRAKEYLYVNNRNIK
ncbi:MAG: ATP-dependent helicase [Culturomica sp.]|jgi:hypothetical protein|nr:ATP-dependent helicase [Culturomica sp.]